jgi:hypothetical protein
VNRTAYRRAQSHVALACLAFVVVAGCRNKEPITSWDSPRLLEIEKEWQSLQDSARRMIGEERTKKYGRKNERLYRVLFDLIRKQLSDNDKRQLAISCGTLPVRPQDRSAFTNEVLSCIVNAFSVSGDRDSLVNLLSTRFPPRIGPVATIEWHLVIRGKNMKDPILILGEAYSQCNIPSVRHDIAAAVRRGFTDLGVRGKDDADFVKNAMQWYEQEKDNLVPNPGYLSSDDSFPLESYEGHPELYETLAGRRPLLFKTKNDKTPGKNEVGGKEPKGT